MKKMILLIAVIVFTLGCQPKKQTLLDEIKKNEQALQAKYRQGIVDTLIIQKLLAHYKKFTENYPEDTLCPRIYYNMARLYVQVKKPQEAEFILTQFEKKYPDHSLLPEVLFFRGFIEENELKDLKSAQNTYTRFLTKFPTHPYADQVRASIQYLGYDPDKILELTQKESKAQ